MNTLDMYFPSNISLGITKQNMLKRVHLSYEFDVTLPLPFVLLSEDPPQCVLDNLNNNHECPFFKSCEGHPDIEAFCTNNLFTEVGQPSVKHSAFYGHVYLFRDATTSSLGIIEIKASNHYYDMGGCWDGLTNTKVRTIQVKHRKQMKEAISLIFAYSHTYYHLMFEMLPAMILMRPFILKNPTIPILVRYKSNLNLVQSLAGLGHIQLNFQELNHEAMVNVNKLYVASYASCKIYPPKLIRGLHEHIYSNINRVFNLKLPQKRPQILLGQRKNTRKLLSFQELSRTVSQKYPTRTSIFDSVLTLKKTSELFSRTDIFVSPHGSGFANMLFMKNTSTIIEIQPDRYEEECFGDIAKLLGMKRYKVVGKGGLETSLSLDEIQFQELILLIDKSVKEFVAK